MESKSILQIVKEDFDKNITLHQFGISIFESPDCSLGEICLHKNINQSALIAQLNHASIPFKTPNKLGSSPIEYIISYLQHSHHHFIKKRFPYLLDLIANFPVLEQIEELHDLKFVFPVFIQDLITHIYEEEDTLFSYILNLQKINNGNIHAGRLYHQLERYSIQQFAVEHEVHDDEMKGIKILTNNFTLPHPSSDIYLEIVFHELQKFEKELKEHANIENYILFPRALSLEKEVKCTIQNKVNLN